MASRTLLALERSVGELSILAHLGEQPRLQGSASSSVPVGSWSSQIGGTGS